MTMTDGSKLVTLKHMTRQIMKAQLSTTYSLLTVSWVHLECVFCLLAGNCLLVGQWFMLHTQGFGQLQL